VLQWIRLIWGKRGEMMILKSLLKWIIPFGPLWNMGTSTKNQNKIRIKSEQILKYIAIYCLLVWYATVVHKIPSLEGTFYTFGLVWYFCLSSQKIKILTALYKQISIEQVVSFHESFGEHAKSWYSNNQTRHLEEHF